jgi:hypothetical protein
MTPSSRSAGTQPITRESWLHAERVHGLEFS